MSFEDLSYLLKVDLREKVGWKWFSFSAEASYMKFIEDKDYTLSLNYYQSVEDSVSVQLKGVGLDGLTSVGQNFYRNGTNPYFRLVCGDNIITSYKHGAQLILGMSVHFHSHEQKDSFTSHGGLNLGDIVKASKDVQRIATSLKIDGNLTIHAMQMGGNPAELSKIISFNGSFSATTCSISNIASC